MRATHRLILWNIQKAAESTLYARSLAIAASDRAANFSGNYCTVIVIIYQILRIYILL
ncbi:hypothetical protein H6G41_14945 [Tolypothrix sp. FACHB-123]|uniref:hypothetical protein n=1 Tax=Tolypothrix sp. FACHB-123 TaxID=2692868 RepID=UPI0016830AE1|nr:hypothetical protein [Tolypothrix sp. FACHB-123]MBD2355900.1 hypothetical protein [Tolypothrix sp. FACHB-123]